jgi:hypothetical protein
VEDVESSAEAIQDLNGLTMNGLTMNGLTTNALLMTGLTANSLTLGGLMKSGAIRTTLAEDPLAQLFMKYVVSCALPAGQTISFPPLARQPGFTFAGELGLAPQWGAAACDATCQQWVSACVISRVNALGQHVSLSERGPSPALALGPGEAQLYPNREATYFGNVLTSPQQIFACRSAGDDPTLIGRACGDGADVSHCAITVLGASCNTACSAHYGDGSNASGASPAAGTFGPAVTVYRM